MKFLIEKNVQKAKLSIEEMPIAPFLLAIQPIIQLVSLNLDQVLVEEIFILSCFCPFALVVFGITNDLSQLVGKRCCSNVHNIVFIW
jgi:hypothetical protein